LIPRLFFVCFHEIGGFSSFFYASIVFIFVPDKERTFLGRWGAHKKTWE